MYSPIIFLSDFDYVYKMPLFRKKQFGTSLLGILLVTAFCYFMVNVEIYAASENYKESRTVYYIENTRESVVLDKKKKDSDTIKGKLYKIREASYYQVQVGSDKKGKDVSFDSNIKTDKIKIKDAKFKNAKTLYVRVRAFYKHNKKSYHGKWSDYTKVTVK